MVTIKKTLIQYTDTLLRTALSLKVTIVTTRYLNLAVLDGGIRNTVSGQIPAIEPIRQQMINYLNTEVDIPVAYCYTDFFDVSYAMIRMDQNNSVVIGPCLCKDPEKFVLTDTILKRNKLADSYRVPLTEYYYSLPVIKQDIFVGLVNDIALRLFERSDYEVLFVNQNMSIRDTDMRPKEGGGQELAKELMQDRYNCENLMIDAVSRGDKRSAFYYCRLLEDRKMRPRSSSYLRDKKNGLIILNTLARKGAEFGGVHPVYLNAISRDYALRIEEINNLEDLAALKLDILRSYTGEVALHTDPEYPPLIVQAVSYINSHLELPLSLKDVADKLSVNPSYLSTQFKKEVGQTLTDYTRDQKIQKAAALLTSTSMQIQNIATAVGFFDVQYFSKQFKKTMGASPSSYRENYTHRDYINSVLEINNRN